jgi:hypothetical protein
MIGDDGPDAQNKLANMPEMKFYTRTCCLVNRRAIALDVIANRVDGDRIIASRQQRVQSDAGVLLDHTADVSVAIVGVDFVIT